MFLFFFVFCVESKYFIVSINYFNFDDLKLNVLFIQSLVITEKNERKKDIAEPFFCTVKANYKGVGVLCASCR